MKLDEELSIFFSKNKFIALFANYVTLWKDICFILTIWINFIIITSFKDNDSWGTHFWSASHSRMNEPTFFEGVLST